MNQLAIDIGNTSITWALMDGQHVLQKKVLLTYKEYKVFHQEFESQMQAIKQAGEVQDIIICSVVPNILREITAPIANIFGIKPNVVGRDKAVPIKNLYQNPDEVGQDRLVCSYAAKHFHGAPSIVIDLGTAITIDVVALDGSYQGGMIVPGIQLSLGSLSSKAALLPDIRNVNAPKQLIGKTTEESILSGVFNGYGAMCHEVIKRLKKELDGDPFVILTGGHAALMQKYIQIDEVILESNLVFKGLSLMLNDRR